MFLHVLKSILSTGNRNNHENTKIAIVIIIFTIKRSNILIITLNLFLVLDLLFIELCWIN